MTKCLTLRRFFLPRVARYLQDCLVFVPSTSLEASGVPETTLSKDVLPYRVCQITALEPANDASSSKCLFDVSVIPLGGSKTSRIPVHMLLDKVRCLQGTGNPLPCCDRQILNVFCANSFLQAFEDHDVQDIRMRIRESDDLKWTGFVERHVQAPFNYVAVCFPYFYVFNKNLLQPGSPYKRKSTSAARFYVYRRRCKIAIIEVSLTLVGYLGCGDFETKTTASLRQRNLRQQFRHGFSFCLS